LHIDGSRHQWFQDERWYDLIVILDDATSEIYYAQLVRANDSGVLAANARLVGAELRDLAGAPAARALTGADDDVGRSQSIPAGSLYTPLHEQFTAAAGEKGTASKNSSSGGVLVESNHVSRRVAEPGGDFRSVCADGLHNFTAIGNYRVQNRGRAVNHDVDEKARICRGLSSADPGAAYFANAVVKSGTSITTLANTPAEHASIEVG